MNDLGFQYGLWLIKTALEGGLVEDTQHVPGQTPEEQSRRMAGLFQENETRDPMTAETMKQGLAADFTAPGDVKEDEDKRTPGPRSVVIDSFDKNTDDAWDEHQSYRTHEHAIVEGTPGPW